MRISAIAIAALFLAPFAAACSSSSSSGAPSGDGGACPDVSGAWKVTAHCDPSLVGSSLVVTENGCTLSFAAPFNQFSGSVTSDGKIMLSGPQSCSGTANPTAVAMTCTPGTCNVTLARP